MNAPEEFMILLLHTHIVAAADKRQALNPCDTLARAIAVNLPRDSENDTREVCQALIGIVC